MTDDGMAWHSAATAYLNRLCRAEYESQRKAHKRAPRSFRYAPSDYVNTLIDCMNKNDEHAFKATKMLEGYATALGV